MRSLLHEHQAEVLRAGGWMGLSVLKATADSSDNGGHWLASLGKSPGLNQEGTILSLPLLSLRTCCMSDTGRPSAWAGWQPMAEASFPADTPSCNCD